MVTIHNALCCVTTGVVNKCIETFQMHGGERYATPQLVHLVIERISTHVANIEGRDFTQQTLTNDVGLHLAPCP
jgi:hypothetical protein